jgi:hypothetical protein
MQIQGSAFMCDYSLHVVASRPAELAETIVTTGFWGTRTRGFASPADSGTAVCLRPGTEVVFEHDVYAESWFFGIRRKVKSRLARFRQINMDNPEQHHDALEFANGRTVLVTDLVLGQRAKVLQLPVTRSEKPAVEKPAVSVSPSPVPAPSVPA